MKINFEVLRAGDKEYWNEVAPEGATHVAPTHKVGFVCFYRIRGERNFDFWYKGGEQDGEQDGNRWAKGVGNPCHKPLVERPLMGDKEWNGEGVPPVGTECEGDPDTRGQGYEPCLIVYHDPDADEFEHATLALFKHHTLGRYVHPEWCSDFRPIDDDRVSDKVIQTFKELRQQVDEQGKEIQHLQKRQEIDRASIDRLERKLRIKGM